MITLFTNDCPKCKVLKSKLESKKIEYKESNDLNVLEEQGYRTLPMLRVRDKYLDFMESVSFVNNY